jgi:hypothetical protein
MGLLPAIVFVFRVSPRLLRRFSSPVALIINSALLLIFVQTPRIGLRGTIPRMK